MKKFRFNHLWYGLLSLSILVSSCHPDVKDSPLPVENTQTMKYRGVEVVIPANFPKEALNPSFSSFTTRAQNVFGVTFSNARVSGEEKEQKQDISELLKMLAEEKVKTPDLSKYPLQEADLKRISRDFPSLKTEQDVRNYQEAVFNFYNDLVREAVLQKLAKKNKGARGELALFLTGGPLLLALWVGWPYVWINRAREDADHRVLNDMVGGRYGGTPGIDWDIRNMNDYKNNAYRHSLWNALGVKYMIDAGVSRNSSVNIMRDVATSYEAAQSQWNLFWNTASFPGNNPQQLFPWINTNTIIPSGAMDLNNNLVGRTYVYKNIGWGVFGLFRNLSYTEICDHLRTMAENAQYYAPSNGTDPILQRYDANPNEALDRLKWWPYDDNGQNLIYIKP